MGCESELVANSGNGSVTVCACGTISINYGNGTLRISVQDFTMFARMVDEAFARIAQRELTRPHGNGIYPGSGTFCC